MCLYNLLLLYIVNSYISYDENYYQIIWSEINIARKIVKTIIVIFSILKCTKIGYKICMLIHFECMNYNYVFGLLKINKFFCCFFFFFI
jgi:hypothetical protein